MSAELFKHVSHIALLQGNTARAGPAASSRTNCDANDDADQSTTMHRALSPLLEGVACHAVVIVLIVGCAIAMRRRDVSPDSS
jgi:hypothetical protein